MGGISFSSRYMDKLKVGEVLATFSRDGSRILRYQVDLRHTGLDRHKVLSAPELFLLEGKAEALLADWDKKYDEVVRKSKLTASKVAADELTAQAAVRLDELNNILKFTLKVDDRVDWEELKDRKPFARSKTFKEQHPMHNHSVGPTYVAPQISFLDVILGRKGRKLREAQARFEGKKAAHEEEEAKALTLFAKKTDAWQERKKQFEAEWEAENAAYLSAQTAANDKIDALAAAVVKGDAQAVIEHASIVMELSNYGDLFQKSFEVDYLATEKTLLVEYELPSPDHVPTLRSVKFVPATGELKETHIPEKDQKQNFDLVCYQICLRTIHELFEADEWQNLDHVLFNGYSTKLNPATGKEVRACIMSVLVKRNEFLDFDLSRVDPKACFKNLKGVSASSLSALAPIPPVMEIDRNDKRFVDARNVVDSIGEATNLASMGWEDFEHLIRELFEKEFSSRGGEVKITQASSDGGVDAIAFDPDPITGGKVVIQAKRYTRTVGVAAVRDLYGTVMNEGASKGLLVTTADFGPDAHKFASGKPITLISGANLLHLLERHGYNAKIDLKGARQDLGLR